MTHYTSDNKEDTLIYKVTRSFVKIVKIHQNIANHDKLFVERAMKDAQLDLDNC